MLLRLIVPYLLQQRLNVVVSECIGSRLTAEQLQLMLQRMNSTLSQKDVEAAIAEMDANGNGVVTDQELCAWFIKSETEIALLDSASFPDAAPRKKDKKKTTEVGAALKPKQKSKSKKGGALHKESPDSSGIALNSITCEADTNGVETEQQGSDLQDCRVFSPQESLSAGNVDGGAAVVTQDTASAQES
jgi:hypothetical protein